MLQIKKTSVFFFRKTNVFFFFFEGQKTLFFVFIAQFKGKVKFEVYFKYIVKTKKSLNKIIRYCESDPGWLHAHISAHV